MGRPFSIVSLIHLAKRAFYRLTDAIGVRWHIFAVNACLLALGSYFTLQKLHPFSPTEFLGAYLPSRGVEAVKSLLVWIVGYSSIIKLITFAGEVFPKALSKSEDPGKLNSCVLLVNDEIKRHLLNLNAESNFTPDRLASAHQFEVNVAAIASYMGDHIVGCFAGLKAKPKDIFISVYKIAGFEGHGSKLKQLEYVTHYPLARDTVNSKTIKLEDPAFQAYECVKAVRTSEQIVLKFDCADYAKSKNSRHKTSKHYIGFLLEADGKQLGFVTVEFHKYNFFLSLDAMAEFLEKELFAFRCLIEYQFLKRRFFTQVRAKITLAPSK